MAADKKHVNWAAEANVTTFGGIQDVSIGTGTEVIAEAASGEVYPRALYIVAQKPGAQFGTKAIAGALAQCGLSGTNLATLGAAVGLKLYGQKHEHGGTRSAGATHRKYTFACGLWLPRQLTVDHRGDAVLTYEVLCCTPDGTNAPFSFDDSVALPAITGDDDRFTLGSCWLEDVLITQMTGLSIDFGLTAALEASDSSIWDTLASIETIKPVVSITGTDIEWLGAAKVPLAGLLVTEANTDFFLRKRATGATYVADGTEEHIKFSGAGLATIDTVFSGSGQQGATCSINMPMYYDGTNDPLAVTLASAIAAPT